MNFLFLGIFSGFFWLILPFLNDKKMIQNTTKKGGIFARVPRGCEVARKATWQRHTGPRGAYAVMWHIIYIYLYSGYNIYSLPIIGR